MTSTDPTSRQQSTSSSGEPTSERSARRTQRDRTRDASRASDKYSLFEVDGWRVGGYVAGAIVFGGLYLIAVMLLDALVIPSTTFTTLITLLLGLAGLGYLLFVLVILVRRPRVVLYEAVTTIALLLTASQTIPRYTTIDARRPIVLAIFCLPPAVLAFVWDRYVRYRSQRPTDRSRRSR